MLINNFGFTHMAQVAAQGNSGGMVMMWRRYSGGPNWNY